MTASRGGAGARGRGRARTRTPGSRRLTSRSTASPAATPARRTDGTLWLGPRRARLGASASRRRWRPRAPPTRPRGGPVLLADARHRHRRRGRRGPARWPPGERLVVVEAMKMEHVLTAPVDGVVRELRARRRRSTVARDAVLLIVEPEAEGGAEHHGPGPERGARGAARDRRGLRAQGGRPGHRRPLRARASSRTRSSRRWARWACSACRSPRSTAAWAATTSRCASRWRSWPGSTPSVAITLEAGVSLGAMPIYRFGTDEQKQRVAARARRGREARRVRADRARRRLRRRRHPHHRAARRRRVGDQRRRRRSSPTPAPTSPRSSPSPRSPASATRRPQGDLGDHRPGRHARASGSSKQYSKVGWCASDTRELFFDDVPRARGQPASASAAAATPSSCRSSTRAASRSRRCRSGWRRAAWTSRCATPTSARRSATRSAATRPSSSRSPTWRRRAHTARLAYYAAAAKMLRGAAVQEGGGDREAGRRPTRRWTTPATPRRSSAATGS